MDAIIVKETIPTQKLGKILGKEKELEAHDKGREIWKRTMFQLKLCRILGNKEGMHRYS